MHRWPVHWGQLRPFNLLKVLMSKVQILLLTEPRELPTKSGGKFQIQDAETVILDDSGAAVVVGPLAVPRDLIGKLVPGLYDASFKWERDYKSGRLVSTLVSLTAFVSAPRPSAAAPSLAPKV